VFESGVGFSAGWLPGAVGVSNVLIGLCAVFGETGPGAAFVRIDGPEGADSGIGAEIGPGENFAGLLPGTVPRGDAEPSAEAGAVVEFAGGGGGPIKLGAGSAPLEAGMGEMVLAGGAPRTHDGQLVADPAGIAVQQAGRATTGHEGTMRYVL
jgi:hypothetical protein